MPTTPRPTAPDAPRALAAHAHGQSEAAVAAFAQTYVPAHCRWVDAPETVRVSMLAPVTLAGGHGMLASYRRDTNFAGSLSEAIRVIEFASNTRW